MPFSGTIKNFKRWDRGLPLEPEPKPAPRPEPEAPIVADRIKFEDIPNLEIRDFGARSRTVKNAQSARFTGWNFYVEFINGKKIQGWLPPDEFQKLKARIPKDRVDLLGKIAL